MEKYYKISVPEPCDEDWNQMMPNKKGRLCHSCKKTVMDFTKLSELEMHEFLSENSTENICGRFRKTQLDGMQLTIPAEIIQNRYSFRKAFLLALVIAMGSTLLSCTNTEGNQQRIDKVQIVEKKRTNTTKTTCSIMKPIPPKRISLPKLREESVIMGIPVHDASRMLTEPISFASLDEFPSFPGISEKKRSKEKFQKELKEFVSKEFNTKIGDSLGLKGTHRIYTQFEINKNGIVENIKIRASHSVFEKEAIRVLEKIPKLHPGKYQHKKVVSFYSLPIVFNVAE